MTNPQPTTRRILGEYQPNQTPDLVKRWENRANNAPTDSAAQTQLIYHLLLQVRALKLIAFWALFGIPTIITIVMVILANTIDFSSPPSYFR